MTNQLLLRGVSRTLHGGGRSDYAATVGSSERQPLALADKVPPSLMCRTQGRPARVWQYAAFGRARSQAPGALCPLRSCEWRPSAAGAWADQLTVQILLDGARASQHGGSAAAAGRSSTTYAFGLMGSVCQVEAGG